MLLLLLWCENDGDTPILDIGNYPEGTARMPRGFSNGQSLSGKNTIWSHIGSERHITTPQIYKIYFVPVGSPNKHTILFVYRRPDGTGGSKLTFISMSQLR